MVSVVYDYVKDKFELGIVPVMAPDVINLVQSDNQVRPGFKFLCDFYIENQYVGTLKPQPFNNFGECYVNSFTKNLLTWDKNFYTEGFASNPNSIKIAQIKYGEEFSRTNNFFGITGSTYATDCSIVGITGSGTVSNNAMFLMNGNNQITLNDRVLVVKDDLSINPQYASYFKIVDIKYNQFGFDYGMVLNVPYNYSQFTETGFVYEGYEYYDYTNPDGISPTLWTTNAHTFNVGDQIVLQMDNVWKTTLNLSGLPNGSIVDRIYVFDGTYSLPVPTNITNDPLNIIKATYSNFLDDLAFAINCHEGDFGWKAIHNPGSNLLHIFSPFNFEFQTTDPSNRLIIVEGPTVSIGNFVYKDSRVDNNGAGFNPQASGVYTVLDVPASNQIRIDRNINDYKNTEANAEFGTIYSFDKYTFRDLLIGGTFHYMLATTDDFETYSLSPYQNVFVTNTNCMNFLGNSKTDYKYYSDGEVYTFDMFRGGYFTSSSYKAQLGQIENYLDPFCQTDISANGNNTNGLPITMTVVDPSCLQNRIISGYSIPFMKWGCCLSGCREYDVTISFGTFSYIGDEADLALLKFQMSSGKPGNPYGPNSGGIFIDKQDDAYNDLDNVSKNFTLIDESSGFTYSYDSINNVTSGWGGTLSFSIRGGDGCVYLYPFFEMDGFMTIEDIDIKLTNSNIDSIYLETYNSNNSIIASYSINPTLSFDEKVTFGLGPYNINKLLENDRGAFTPEPIDYPIGSSVSSYTAVVKDPFGAQISQVVTFEKHCAKNGYLQFIWLNSAGAWNSISFDNLDYLIEDVEIARSNYSKVPNYTKSKSANIWNSNPVTTAMVTDDGRRGITTFNIDTPSLYTYTTPLLNRIDNIFFNEVFSSPEVFIIVDIEDCSKVKEIPITITTETIRRFNQRDKLFQYSFQFRNSIYKNGFRNL